MKRHVTIIAALAFGMAGGSIIRQCQQAKQIEKLQNGFQSAFEHAARTERAMEIMLQRVNLLESTNIHVVTNWIPEPKAWRNEK